MQDDGVADRSAAGRSRHLTARPARARAVASSCRAAARPSSARCGTARARRPRSCSTAGVATGGLNWFQTFDALGEQFRVIAPDLPRPRPRAPQPARVPARRLRRRLRGDVGRARHRPGDRRRLLDGRPDRAAALAPSPRSRLRPGVVRDDGGVHPRTGEQRLSYQSAMLAARGRRARAATLSRHARGPWSRIAIFETSGVDRRRDAPPRLALDRGGRPLDQHVPRGPVDRRSTFPTAVVCTTKDRGVRPELTARARRLDPRHHRPPDRRRPPRLRAARASPPVLVEACTSVADPTEPPTAPLRSTAPPTEASRKQYLRVPARAVTLGPARAHRAVRPCR